MHERAQLSRQRIAKRLAGHNHEPIFKKQGKTGMTSAENDQ